VAYIFGIIGVKMFLHALSVTGLTQELQWTAVGAIHTVVTFWFVHYTKGSPDEFSQGDFDGDTLWEQMDGGVPWTFKKKFLIVVPCILFLIASYASDFASEFLIVNLICLGLNIVPKLPQMHKVRILGINRTAGIDDDPRNKQD